MGDSKHELMGVLAATTHQWVRCVMFVTHCYASVLDPRPDLAMPARAVRTPYLWWW